MFSRLDRPARRRARRLIFAGVALVGACGFAAYFRRPLFEGNVGVVHPGLVFRSAQPTGDRLTSLAREHRLQTVLNLRGGTDDKSWYAAEVADARRLGLDFYDLPLSATTRPSRKHLLTVLDLLDRCRYPLLIHCKSGSDRTGLVAGLYLMSRKGVPPERAEEAFSLAFGHVPLLGTKRLHEPFDEYADWLRARDLPHTPARFRSWVEHEYRADDPLVAVRPLPPGPRADRVAKGGATPGGPAAR